jgi:hypothetical protein
VIAAAPVLLRSWQVQPYAEKFNFSTYASEEVSASASLDQTEPSGHPAHSYESFH